MAKELWTKHLHPEHISPNKVIRSRLIREGQKLTISKCHKIMIDCETVILTKEESVILDGSTYKNYLFNNKLQSGKGLKSKGSRPERLSSIGAVIENKTLNNRL